MDPGTGEITRFAMPEGVRDPHTLVFDGRGGIWFTAQGANVVGRLATATGDVRIVRVPRERARPYGIVVDAQGRPWFNELGNNRISTVDPATFQLASYEVPRADARTRRIGVTSDGQVWYADWAGGYLGRMDPTTQAFREWAAPSGAESRPYAMAVDDRDRVWFVETGVQPNRMTAFDPATGEYVFSEPVPSGGGSVRHMVFHPATRTIWFGTDANTIGRVRVP
jgi:virginiamycin B lyase